MRKFYLSAIFSFTVLCCTAQAKLSVLPGTIHLSNATPRMGDTITVSFSIMNTGNATYSAPIRGHFTTTKLTSALSGDSVTSGLTPGSVLSLTISNIKVNADRFVVGNNIIIVWPTGTVTVGYDSASQTVKVDPHVGIHDPINKDERVRLIPNPATKMLSFDPGTSLQLRSLQLLDINGKVVYESDAKEHTIDISTLPEGLYLICFTTQDGELIRMKLLTSH